MSDAQALEVANMMVRVLDSFIDQPHATMSELKNFPHASENHVPCDVQLPTIVPPQYTELKTSPSATENHVSHGSQLPATVPSKHTEHAITTSDAGVVNLHPERDPAIQTIVSECVQEVIQTMMKSGLLRNPNVNQEQLSVIEQPESDQSSETVDTILSSDNSDNTDSTASSSCDSLEQKLELRNSLMARQPAKRGRLMLTEQKLRTVWTSILEICSESISSHDSFFDLGGDSITAMKLVGVAREAGLSLTVADVFRHPTFGDMATIIRVASVVSEHLSIIDLDTDDDCHNRAARPSLKVAAEELYERFALVQATDVDAFLQSSIYPKVGVFKGGIADVLPVTDFQSLAITGSLMESRWMLNYFYLDGAAPLNLALLKQSCFRLVQNFDILRTVFLPSGDRFLQVVLRKLRPDFEVIETDEDFSSFTNSVRANDRAQPPKLGEPFIRFVVATRKDSNHHRILIRMSHAQYDGICLPTILGALHQAYQGGPMPACPSFATYVRESAKTVTSAHYEHWRNLLRDSSMTEVVQRIGPNYRGEAAETVTLRQKVRLPLVTQGNITTATIVKAAWALVLAQFSAQPDVVFGHTISGRNAMIPGIEDTVGPCLNMVPVRIQFGAKWTAMDLLKYVQEQQVGNMPYEALGFREIIKHCTDWPDWTTFSTGVQHQNVDQNTEMVLGEHEYQMGGIGVDDDFSDIFVVSTPLRDNEMVELSLSFSLHGAITRELGQDLLNKLTVTASNFSTRPNTTMLPSPEEFCNGLIRTLPDVLRSTETSSTGHLRHLENLSRAELFVLRDIITRAWQQVLGEESKKRLQGQGEKLSLETSFFDLGGDIVSVAQVAWVLEQEGFKVRVEDLVNRPTVLGQMALLGIPSCSSASASSSDMSYGRSEGEMGALPSRAEVRKLNAAAVNGEPVMLQKSGRSQTFGKAVGSLAKKMVRRNTRTSDGS